MPPISPMRALVSVTTAGAVRDVASMRGGDVLGVTCTRRVMRGSGDPVGAQWRTPREW